MSSLGGWSCQRCTYYHRYSGPRCVMCNELRISKKQMHDFIKGIPMDEDDISLSKQQGPQKKKKEQRNMEPLSFAADDHSGAAAPIFDTESLNGNFNQENIIADRNGASWNSSRPTAAALSKNSPAINNPYMKKTPQNLLPSNNAIPTTAPNKNPLTSSPHHHSSSAPHRKTMAPNCPPSAVDHQPAHHQPLKAADTKQQLEHHDSQIRRHNQPAAMHAQQQNDVPTKISAKHKNHFQKQPTFQPGPVPVDENCVGEWIFPQDNRYPRRQYQFDIARTAVLHNTLVGLPTGLGKTLIAAVVMYNYYRWFPTGKVVFMAPTLPLVHQQVRACYDIMRIPECDTAILTGKMSPSRRSDVWTDRRAFFCTPQTLQKDIDQNRVDPKLIVLVVFDEAHRARGDYAYNKIVQQLEQGEAQFRVLGLSATPGSQIKIIQEVVTSLRINKVECRSDEDPDVQQYIHDRQTEVVLVKQQSACKHIEICINDMLQPLLQKLRTAQALPYFGNATLTQWLILKARKEYVEKTNDFSLSSIFEAARFLVEIRNLLYQQGVGVVRAKLIRARDEKKGLGNILQTDLFGKLMELVLQSTCDPNSKKSTVDEKVMNNPKLQKLQEILLEHFERAKATGRSSRAIVFSQFRDSVGEIVDVLQSSRPMVRPRHFVGQGKGSGSTDRSSVMKGMTQSEQQKVIKQFQDNIHNVLVCTCIGEEGLDIGEVDLIVNFDSLQSPVRMLQRVGRTGRKRDGRVVFLIAEGAEEKTYRESKERERTIMRAMKQADAFKVTATAPLLPVTPIVCVRDMMKTGNFHMSQVEGLDDAKRSMVSSDVRSWKLSEDSEARRAAALGDSKNVRSLGSDDAIRKRILSARQFNGDSFKKKTRSRLGQVSALLRDFECNALFEPEREGKVARRKGRCSFSDIDVWFPLMESEEVFEALAWGKPYPKQRTAIQEKNSDEKEITTRIPLVSNPFSVRATERPVLTHVHGISNKQEDRNLAMAEPHRQNVCAADETKSAVPLPNERDDANEASKWKGTEINFENSIDDHETPSTDKPRLGTDSVENGYGVGDAEDHAFQLPTPSSSSDEESDDDSAVDRAARTSVANVQDGKTNECAPRTKHNKVGSNESINVQETTFSKDEMSKSFENAAFSLPTQLSSSSSSSSDEDSSQGQKTTRPHKSRPCVEESTIVHTKSDSSPQNQKKKKHRFDDDDSEEINGKVGQQRKAAKAQKYRVAEEDSDKSVQEVPRKARKSEGANHLFYDEGDSDVSVGKHKTKNRTRGFGEDDSDPIAGKVVPSAKASKVQKRCIDDEDSDEHAGNVPKKAKQRRRVIDDSLEFSVDDKIEATDDKPNCPSSDPQHITANKAAKPAPTVNTEEGCFTGTKGPEKESRMLKTRLRRVIDDDIPEMPVPLKSNCPTVDLMELDDSEESISPSNINIDDIVCAICLSGESSDIEPIYLCDGPGRGAECSLAVHAKCYSVTITDADVEWRCDPCFHRFHGGTDTLVCFVCGKGKGPLKRLSKGKWVHSYCKVGPSAVARVEPKDPWDEKDVVFRRKEKRRARKEKKDVVFRKEKDRFRKENGELFDEEALIASDEDIDGDEAEEEDIMDIEEEEQFHSEFINDSSQLGHSAEKLAGEDACDDIHRAVDMEDARQDVFKTPILNRRMKRQMRSQRLSDSSPPGSAGGLGNMNFIRSVIEHHRRGGTAEDIEEFYHQMEAAETSNVEGDPEPPERPEPRRTVVKYQERDSEDEWPE